MTLVTRDRDSFSLTIKPEADFELVRLSVVRGLGEPDTHVFMLTPDEALVLARDLHFVAQNAALIQTRGKKRKDNG